MLGGITVYNNLMPVYSINILVTNARRYHKYITCMLAYIHQHTLIRY